MSDDDRWRDAYRRAREDYERRFEIAAARYERWVIQIAAELVRIAKADKEVPPAGPLRDGPDTDGGPADE